MLSTRARIVLPQHVPTPRRKSRGARGARRAQRRGVQQRRGGSFTQDAHTRHDLKRCSTAFDLPVGRAMRAFGSYCTAFCRASRSLACCCRCVAWMTISCDWRAAAAVAAVAVVAVAVVGRAAAV
eukprot:5016135-Prymnesium_polylepis.2